MLKKFSPLASALLLVSACSLLPEAPHQTTTATQQANTPIRFLAFGDSGYQLDYLDAGDNKSAFTSEQEFIADDRARWLADGRPAADFRPSPMQFHAGLQRYVPASGLQPVATAMKSFCAQQACDFAVMLGDNIYPSGATEGADGHDDATRFDKLFKQPFAELGQGRAGFRTYVALGNHDWKTSRAGAQAQVEYLQSQPAFYNAGFFYQEQPANTHGLVELFVIDTELLLATTTVYKAKLAADGSELRHTERDHNAPWATPQTAAEANQLAWLAKAMQESKAKWKFLIAHHPVWASGGSKFEQGHALRRLLMPIACRYADAYFAGHEHTLELHEDSCAGTGVADVAPLPQIVSGAAAKQRNAKPAFMAYQNQHYPEKITRFVADRVWGFSAVELHDDNATVIFYQTANDGSGVSAEAFRHSFKRRSGGH